MGKVTCVEMDVVTEKSGHTVTPMAVSVCLTPAAPAPLPIPYPVVASVSEGISDTPMRTKIEGVGFATTGSVLKTCHGNEPGTLKEVVSLNTTGPVFPIMGAPTVLSELGMISITGSPCVSNKAPTPGAGGSASDAGGSSSKGGGSGGDGSGDGKDKKADDQKGGGGADGDGTSKAASATPATPKKQDEYCPDKGKNKGRSAPAKHQADIDRADIRNRKQQVDKYGTPKGKEAANAAMTGTPGSANAKGQAFYSGAGRQRAETDGYAVQEKAQDSAGNPVGAAKLEQMAKANELPDWKPKPDGSHEEAGAGSGVTNSNLWRTISRRSAQNSKGSVDAFVVGSSRPDSVFSSTELPTLLHNKKVDEIKFHDPTKTPSHVETWTRNKTTGCWNGPKVSSGGGPHPGFQLDSGDGFSRPPHPC